jgi:putative FmdB family regulatory protein
MPIYEFFCPQCKNEFELRFSLVQTESTTLCPKCHSIAERLVSSFACKTGGNLQAAEKPFREATVEQAKTRAKTVKKRKSKKASFR